MSNFSIKILGINFDNFVSDNSNWDKKGIKLKKKSICETESNPL